MIVIGFFIVLATISSVVTLIVYRLAYSPHAKSHLPEMNPEFGSAKRFYFYGAAFVSLIIASNGIIQIGVSVLDAIFSTVLLVDTRLAVGLSLVIVGIPLWWVHWRTISRQIMEVPAESQSLIRKIHLYIVLGISVATGIPSAILSLTFLFGDTDFDPYHWIALVVWGLIWIFHWRFENNWPTSGTQTVRRIYIYITSACLLSVSAFAAGSILQTIFKHLYLLVIDRSLIIPASDGLWLELTGGSLAAVICTTPIWAAHWLYLTRGDHESVLRQIYLYGFAVFGSAVTLIVSVGLISYGTLSWVFGIGSSIESNSLADHFEFLPTALSTIIIGMLILTHHWSKTTAEGIETIEGQHPGHRAYGYALTAVGVILIALAIGALVDGVLQTFENTTERILLGENLWRNRLASFTTFSLLGVPLWTYQWSNIRRRTSIAETEEVNHPIRRVFVFGIIGSGMAILVGSVIFIMTTLFGSMIEGDMSYILSDSRTAISIAIPICILLPYHWIIYRQDRKLYRKISVPLKNKHVSLLISEQNKRFANELQKALGFTVHSLYWTDSEAIQPNLSTYDVETLAEKIMVAESEKFLLIPEPNGMRILCYK